MHPQKIEYSPKLELWDTVSMAGNSHVDDVIRMQD